MPKPTKAAPGAIARVVHSRADLGAAEQGIQGHLGIELPVVAGRPGEYFHRKRTHCGQRAFVKLIAETDESGKACLNAVFCGNQTKKTKAGQKIGPGAHPEV